MRKEGFTLIELLVVISLVSLLSSVLIGNLNASREKAENSKILSQLKQYENAIYLVYDDDGRFPSPRELAGVAPLPAVETTDGVCLGAPPDGGMSCGQGIPGGPGIGYTEFMQRLRPYISDVPKIYSQPIHQSNDTTDIIFTGPQYLCNYPPLSYTCAGARIVWTLRGYGATSPPVGLTPGVTYCVNGGSVKKARRCYKYL